jgi:soluble lytic murein transglycosylase-like protein
MRRSRQTRHLRAIAAAVAVTVAGAVAGPATAADSPTVAESAAERIAQFVTSAAQRFAIPEAWIYAVMHAESAGDERAVSRDGAMGLMQIMPATWAYLRGRYGLGANPFDARDNITAGAAWLRELHDRYGSPGFLAAYNAGPARYDDHLATGRPLPAETRAYLAELAPIAGDPVALRPLIAPLAWTRAALFPTHTDGPSTAGNPATTPSVAGVPNSLFLPLSGQAPRP